MSFNPTPRPPPLGFREGERICRNWLSSHQISMFSIIFQFSRQRVTLPQSLGFLPPVEAGGSRGALAGDGVVVVANAITKSVVSSATMNEGEYASIGYPLIVRILLDVRRSTP